MSTELVTELRKMGNLLSLGGRVPLAQSLLRRCFRHAQGVIRIKDFDGDLDLDLDVSEHMQRRIFWMGYYSREIVALLDRIVHRGMVFIDVGANIGEITLVAAKRVGGAGQVISFEPMDAVADKLVANIGRNRLDQVTVVRTGLADAVGSAPIYASCGQGADHDEHHGLGSLYGGSAGEVAVQTIQITTLDSFLALNPISRLDIVKIDIEGAELPCLKGAVQTLRRFKPLLIIEVQAQSSTTAGYQQADILDYLAPLGYRFQSIGRSGRLRPLGARDLASYQNVLCTPTDKQ
ncbi:MULTISPECIES: FkbM family methyltransferase [unclassified Pseudoxanthomonas]|uniref:FkbM family methyltransferase n=1 Tax=unclassified Pseudoxanthomonas TaxID=2645906 RepID=UPI003077C8ED